MVIWSQIECSHPSNPNYRHSAGCLSAYFIYSNSSFFQKVSQFCGTTKFNAGLRIPPPGLLRGFTNAAYLLWTVPVHTWSQSLGACSSWLSALIPTSTPPLLLPLQPVFGWHLFYLHHHLEDDCGHSNSQQCYLLCGLPDTDVHSCSFWVSGQSASDCDGL